MQESFGSLAARVTDASAGGVSDGKDFVRKHQELHGEMLDQRSSDIVWRTATLCGMVMTEHPLYQEIGRV